MIGALERLRLLLFDLDGTLVDTAPDLSAALNELRREEGCPPLPYGQLRSRVSEGASALVRLGFADADAGEFPRLRERFLTLYSLGLARKSRLFPGMEGVLEGLRERELCWGIVTNKPRWLTEPLLHALEISEGALCVVSGDTTTNRKPHPEPLLHAAALSGRRPAECLYIGDARRDVEAGRAAGMSTLVARYGYIAPLEDPSRWGADGAVASPAEILPWLDAFQLGRSGREPP